jgi:hypothetical protein
MHGENIFGQLGFETPADHEIYYRTWVATPGSNVVALAAGDHFSMALNPYGELWARPQMATGIPEGFM